MPTFGKNFVNNNSVNSQQNANSNPFDPTWMEGIMSSSPASSSQQPSGSLPAPNPNKVVPRARPPPIPPRPQNMTYRSTGTLSSWNSPYGRYPLSLYGGGGYGSGMGLGYGMPRSGMGLGYGYPGAEMNNAENAFFRLAEESSRPAFQSIESLVTAVGSINMMLESTYYAIYNSYHAILGVVESFSQLRNHAAHILSTLALLRTFQWLVRRLLYFLGLSKTNPSVDTAWSMAKEVAANNPTDSTSAQPSSMPILIFLAVVFGAPWLISRIFARLAKKNAAKKEATTMAVALYDFTPTHPGEISLRAGQRLVLAPASKQPKTNTWCLVSAGQGGQGLVPSNYVAIKNFRPKPKQSTSGATSEEVPSNDKQENSNVHIES